MLFPAGLANRQYSQFTPRGFDRPVTGVVYNDASDQQGVPMGGLGTGWIGLGLDGTLDYYGTMFNHFLERRYGAVSHCSVPEENPDHWIERKHIPRHRQPFLAMTINGNIQPLTTRWVMGDNKPACSQIDYFGHYPIADLQYETRDESVEVGLRAWTPFIPGDAEASNTPGSVYEIHVKNLGNETKSGHVFFSFHGPREAETRGKANYTRKQVNGKFTGVEVTGVEPNNDAFSYSYALGAIDGQQVITGGEVHISSNQHEVKWYTEFNQSEEERKSVSRPTFALLGPNLPEPEPDHGGATVGAYYSVEPGEETVVRFALTWHAPRWRTQVRGPWVDGGYVHGTQEFLGGNDMIHHYAERFDSASAVANYLAENHTSLLDRIIAWQSVIYSDDRLPGWLQDALVNVFAILPHVSYWMRHADPEHWTNTDDDPTGGGVFCCVENLMTCPQQGCLANDEWGEWTINIFFPDLARKKLRLYEHDLAEDGNMPSTLGFGTDCFSHWYDQQPPVDGQAWTQILDRIWQVTGDDSLLDQYYETSMKNLDYLKSIDEDGDGILDVNGSNQYYDTWPTMAGASSHMGTYWLSTLKMVERMAEKRGDTDRIKDVGEWYNKASKSLEEKLWNEETQSYLVFHQPETGVKSDSILADQILGQFFVEMHGLSDLLPEDRIKTVLNTIWTHNVKAAEFGVRTSIRPDLSHDGTTHHSGMQTPSYSSMVPACLMMRHGMKDEGLYVMESTWRKMVCDGDMAWDQPCMLKPDGSFGFGIEYYHNTMLWVVPLALLGETLVDCQKEDSLVGKILSAVS